MPDDNIVGDSVILMDAWSICHAYVDEFKICSLPRGVDINLGLSSRSLIYLKLSI